MSRFLVASLSDETLKEKLVISHQLNFMGRISFR